MKRFLPAQERYRWFHPIQVTPDDVEAVCPDASGRVWFGTTRGLFRLGDSPEDVAPAKLACPAFPAG